MNLKSQINAVQERLRLLVKGQEDTTLPELSVPAVQSVSIERQHYVFGLDWRFFSDSKDLRQTLSAARRSGLSHYAKTSTDDLVGLGHGLDPQQSAKAYSGALQLAETVSRGGMELFVFKLAEDVFSITALQDARPLVDFDRVGTRSEIFALAGQFQMQQVGQDLRQAGNTGTLDNEEPVKLAEAFGKPQSTARVKPLPNYRQQLILLIAVLGLGLTMWLVWGWLNAENIKASQAKRVREQEPNFIYEKAAGDLMNIPGLPAQQQLDSWRQVIKNIPVKKKGWELTGVICQPQVCQAKWIRSFGNYKEFYLEALPGLLGSRETQDADNPALGGIQAELKVPLPPSPGRMPSRADLPALRELTVSLASQLQDLALLPNGSVQMKAPDLYPPTPGIKTEQIQKPIVRGEWSMTHDLWTLGELTFNGPSLVADSLSLVKSETTNEWTYTLTGHYYAKANHE